MDLINNRGDDVTNVEERRRGPRPKCETERTGATLSVQDFKI
mgnify:CR=1 FL=1